MARQAQYVLCQEVECEFLGDRRGPCRPRVQATHPGVVLRPGTPALLGRSRDLSPNSRDVIGTVKHWDTAEPLVHPPLANRSPLPTERPLRQLPCGHECHRWLAPDQFRQQTRRELPFETQRRDVSVQDDPVHQLGQVGSPGRVGVGDELFQFLIGVKDTITSQVIRRLSRDIGTSLWAVS
jgi:hypothetical protein